MKGSGLAAKATIFLQLKNTDLNSMNILLIKFYSQNRVSLRKEKDHYERKIHRQGIYDTLRPCWSPLKIFT